MSEPPEHPSQVPQADSGYPWATTHFGLAREDAQPYFQALETLFNRRWLDHWQQPNRLAQTWQRRDFLAGMELACLGAAVQQVLQLDPPWAKAVAKKIREGNGSEHGFIFELLACGMLAGGGMDVRPCRKNTPGKDAEIVFPDGFTLRLSFKNHDLSEHEKTFRQHAASLRGLLHSRMRPGDAIQLAVQGLQHLVTEDFEAVRKALAQATTGELLDIIPGRVALKLHRLVPGPGEHPFAPDRRSDRLLVLCPQHPNEQANFATKLKKACDNMRQHCKRTPSSANLLFMRLHPSADAKQLAQLADALLQDKSCGVDAIVLYQPSIARTEDGLSTLLHHVLFVPGPDYPLEGRSLRMESLVGRTSSEPSVLQLQVGEHTQRTYVNHYMYQVGDAYRLLRVDAGVNVEGNLTATAPGVREHLVVQMPSGNFELRGRFAQQEELMLL